MCKMVCQVCVLLRQAVQYAPSHVVLPNIMILGSWQENGLQTHNLMRLDTTQKPCSTQSYSLYGILLLSLCLPARRLPLLQLQWQLKAALLPAAQLSWLAVVL